MAKKQEVEARHYDVVLAPHITEKATLASENNAVVFKVANDATKPQIKEAIEALYDRKVAAVNTMNVKGKSKRWRGKPYKRTDLLIRAISRLRQRQVSARLVVIGDGAALAASQHLVDALEPNKEQNELIIIIIFNVV